MKKLQKKVQENLETVQAYVCNCQCGGCSGCDESCQCDCSGPRSTYDSSISSTDTTQRWVHLGNMYSSGTNTSNTQLFN